MARPNRNLVEKREQMALIQELVNALVWLRDAQNGSPLLGKRHEEFWNGAMAAADAAIKHAAEHGIVLRE